MRTGAVCVLLLLATRLVVSGQERTVRNSIGMELVLIEPGSFVVGTFRPVCPTPADVAEPAQDVRARWSREDHERCEQMVKQDARPGFTVVIDRPYYIGKYEVTQGEWTKVMGFNPSFFQGVRVDGDAPRHPVDRVTWEDAQTFIRTLNELERTRAYRLPTEFEWEYAGRAGASADPTWSEIREMAWQQAITHPATRPVGSRKPNAWGLHDMLGNVWEWVEDYYNERMFADPAPPREGTTHVLKGGGFLGDVKNTVYSTHAAGPGDGFDVGFRIVREVADARRATRRPSPH